MGSRLAASTEALDGTRQVLRRASHAPGFLYTDPGLYRREIAEIFLKDWLFACREEEIAKPGDYLALRLAEQPLLLTRLADGSINAAYNMCRHRGVEVAYGSGNARVFTCPYHGWSYGLDGRLTGAAHMGTSEGFDPASCRLRRVRVDRWRGHVFVCFDADAPPLATFIAGWEADFGFFGMENCRVGVKAVAELHCNWKLAFENLMDFYHVGVLHAKSFGSRVKWEDDDVLLKDGGAVTVRYQASPSTPGGKPLLGKMPWLENEPYSLARAGYLSPNLVMFGRIDQAGPTIIWPLGPDRCQVVIYRVFPERVFERPDIAEILKVYHDFQLTILEEDRTMIESMQRALSSGAYAPGPMAGLEKPIHHFLNGYIERMFGAARS